MRRLLPWGLLLFVCGCGSATNTSDSNASTPGQQTSTAANATSTTTGATADVAPGTHVADPKVRAALETAHAAIKSGNYRRAVDILGQVIGDDPECAEAFFLRAQLNAVTKMDANAIADFSTAIRLAPQNPRYYNAKGFFLLNRRRTTIAMQDFNAATKLDPKYPEPYNNRGLLLLATGKGDQAIEEFNKAIELNPKYVDAYNNRGVAYQKADRIKEALADLDHAISLDGKSQKSYYNRGLIHYDAGHLDEALGDFTNAIVRDPNNPTLFEIRRRTYKRMKRFAEAQADASKIKQLLQLSALNARIMRNPKDADLYLERGKYFAGTEDDKNALPNFDRALQLNPKLADAYLGRAGVRLRRGETDLAIKDCNDALQIQQGYEGFSLRGDAYLKAGDYPNAIADYERCKRLDSLVAEAYMKHGKALQLAGRADEGRQAVEHAVSIQQSFAESKTAKPAELPKDAEEPLELDATTEGTPLAPLTSAESTPESSAGASSENTQPAAAPVDSSKQSDRTPEEKSK